MANSKAISIRIPDELLEKIDSLAEEKYKSHKGTPNRSLVILDAIVNYFDTLSDTSNIERLNILSDSVSISEFNELRDIVLTLSDNVDQLLENSKIIHSETVKPSHNQLPIFVMSDSVIKTNSSDKDSLTVSELAQRFRMEPRNLGSRKSQFEKKGQSSEFITWSKEQDPDGYAWEYKAGSKLYYRVSLLPKEEN